ncbi:hypothetical protein PAECIP112173_00323 [Paenibacillus sp. JJ-100]|uniref:hypothetical protein n=1 Tax=Paenibacillus sp. JJ-100 TaxID=2974896 RepID=UPI0022FFB044|nr:hypothetical protein [Paenibacillus sp. JJ-100]CAI6022901.1 hypothetical protein PAECIP112173_00323 [Paenibacillus sp. JJ-100]
MLQAIFEYAKTNFGGFISDAIILGAIAFLLKLYFTNSFQKKLESHKGEVNSQLEEVKHKQQRVFKEFDLYTTKRHEIYPELHKKVELAIGHILTNVRHYPDFTTFHTGELEDYMEDNNFSQMDRHLILETHTNNREGAAQLIRDVMRVVDYNEARSTWDDANAYFILNELYLTEQVSELTRSFLSNLFDYWTANDPRYGFDLELNREKRVLREETLPKQRVEFKKILKKGLSESFSE